MAESSGNAKLVVGVVVGAVAATAIVLAFGGRPAAAPPATPIAKAAEPAPKLAAMAPEAPPAAPVPKPASEAGDWRGKIEVGETVTPTPRPHAVPQTASEIADFLQAIAKGNGGEKALKAAVNARYTVELDGRTIQMDVHGVEGVLLDDPAHWVQAVWRPTGCVERRREIEGPCNDDVLAQARAAFIAHALSVVAPATGRLMKPVRVSSGQHGGQPWTSLAFTLSGTKARMAAFFNTNAMKLNYGALTWRPKDRKLNPKTAPDKKSVLPGVVPEAYVIFDGWRTFDGGLRVPTTWCQLAGEDQPKLGDAKIADVACAASFTVRSVRPAAATGALALPKATPQIRAQSGAAYRLAMAAPASGAALIDSIKTLDDSIKTAQFASSLGGIFVVKGTVVAFSQEVNASYPGKVAELRARPRVAVGATRMKLADLAAGVAAFEKKVIAAGFTPIKGERLVFPDTRKKPDPTSELNMLVEVPIAP